MVFIRDNGGQMAAEWRAAGQWTTEKFEEINAQTMADMIVDHTNVCVDIFHRPWSLS
jgi:hypothetical protein